MVNRPFCFLQFIESLTLGQYAKWTHEAYSPLFRNLLKLEQSYWLLFYWTSDILLRAFVRLTVAVTLAVLAWRATAIYNKGRKALHCRFPFIWEEENECDLSSMSMRRKSLRCWGQCKHDVRNGSSPWDHKDSNVTGTMVAGRWGSGRQEGQWQQLWKAIWGGGGRWEAKVWHKKRMLMWERILTQRGRSILHMVGSCQTWKHWCRGSSHATTGVSRPRQPQDIQLNWHEV